MTLMQRPTLETEHPLILVGGKRIAAISGKTINVFDPATGAVIATQPDGDAADVDHAVSVATEAFRRGPWRDYTQSARAKVMWKIADLLEQDAEALAQLE